MKLLIKDIANIQTGLFAKPSDMGEVVYLQSKHFDEFGQLYSKLHPDLKIDEISTKHLLKHGDILFAAKGTKNFAAIYENHNDPAVASTSFFVLRLKDKKVLPEYVAWFLNSNPAQLILKGQARGTSIHSISKKVLENVEIFLPKIETQLTILKISNLRIKERALKIKVETLREKQIQAMLLEAASQL